MIKSRMMEAGTMMIGYQPLGKPHNRHRYICSSCETVQVGEILVSI